MRGILFALLPFSLALEVSAAPGTLLHTLNNPTPSTADNFGFSVAALGSDLLVGAYSDDVLGTDVGAVYLFSGTTGALLLTINNPAPQVGDEFGWAVGAVGGNILVGAHLDNAGGADSGTVYLFNGALRGTTNTPLLTIPAPVGGTDQFGTAVAAVGGNIVVGAPFESTLAINAGTVYVFNGSLTGTINVPLLTINNPTPADQDFFGISVASLGADILVGAYQDDTGFSNSGAAYLFNGSLTGTTNVPLLTINNPSPSANGYFGLPVLAIGSNILVGGYQNDTGAMDAGSAYVFNGALRGTTNTPRLTIRNPTPAISDYFGGSLAVIGSNRILAGAYRDDTGTLDAGSVYVFDGSLTGTISTPLLTINNPSPGNSDHFGYAVAAVGTNLLVGARNDDAVALEAGSAYLFCGLTGACAGGDQNEARDWMFFE